MWYISWNISVEQERLGKAVRRTFSFNGALPQLLLGHITLEDVQTFSAA
jgi:hypothetical protein